MTAFRSRSAWTSLWTSGSRRWREALARGHQTIRITWERLTQNPAQEAARLLAILRAPRGGVTRARRAVRPAAAKPRDPRPPKARAQGLFRPA